MPGPLISSVILNGAYEQIRAAGRSPGSIARRAGLPPEALGSPDQMVSARAVIEFFELAAEICQDRGWGLRLSQEASLAAIVGPLWVLVRNARTVSEMCADLAQNFDLYSSAAISSFEEVPRGALLSWTSATGHATRDVQMAEFAISLFLKEIQLHALPGWKPPAVHFRHQAPTNLRLHRKIFGPHLHFESNRNGFEIDRSVLERPVHGHHPAARGLARRVLRHEDPVTDESLALRVEGLVRALLPHGPCEIGDVCGALGFAPRTLQSKLRATGTSFKAIKDAVRSDLAMKYLIQSRLKVDDIADVLGYADPTSLSRSFRRWNAVSIRKSRANHLARVRGLSAKSMRDGSRIRN
jgi:AraC-like DNA-binding protein